MNTCVFLSGLRLQPPCSHTKKCCFSLGSKSHVNQMSLQIGKNQYVPPGKAGELQPPTSHENTPGHSIAHYDNSFGQLFEFLKATGYLTLFAGESSDRTVQLIRVTTGTVVNITEYSSLTSFLMGWYSVSQVCLHTTLILQETIFW